MQNPEVYMRGNSLQIKVTQQFLNNNFHLIQWKKEGEVVMDIGCGPGSSTWDILRKMLPENFGTIYGVDIEERMIEFGKKHYPSINFVKSDVCSIEFVARFKNSVDHVFSFYCFQWLDPRQLLKNLFDILKPGGDILTIFPAVHPICDAYEKLLKKDKWKKYKKEINYYIIVYHYQNNIEASLRKSITEVGFEILMCKCEDFTYVFETVQELKDFVMGVHPLQNYSDHIQESFVSEVVEEFQKSEYVKKDKSQIVTLQKNISYCVRKPYNN